MRLHPLLRRVKALQLPPGDYAIFGSGPLLVRRIIEQVNDIDIVCRGAAWQRAQRLGKRVYLEEFDVEIVSIDSGAISLGTSWGIGDFAIDELIDTAEVIVELPFVRLEHVVAYKRIANRPKDRRHIELLKRS